MNNPIKKLRAFIRLQRAITKAKDAYQKTGQRQYVVSNYSGQLTVLDRYDLKRLKRIGYYGKSVNVKTLELASVYYTPYLNGTGEMSPELMKERKKGYYNMALGNDTAK